MASIGNLIINIGAKIDGLHKGIGEAVGQVQAAKAKFDSFASGVAAPFKALGSIATQYLLPIGMAGITAGAGLVALGSDAAEMQNKFDTAFGANAEGWANRFDILADKVGRNKYELMDFGASIQSLLTPMGLSADTAGNLSTAFTGLAVDLSSFYNVAESDALNALRSALIGETEPMRQFGVVINEAAIKQEALKSGLIQQGQELTAAAKAQATFNLIMQQTAQAQGDAERTSGGFANQMRSLQASLSEAATAMGMELLPIVTPLLQGFNQFIQGILPQAVVLFQNFAGELQANLAAMLLIQDAWNRIVIAFGGTPEKVTPASVVLAALKAVLDGVITAVQLAALGAQGLAWYIEQWGEKIRMIQGLWNNLQTILSSTSSDPAVLAIQAVANALNALLNPIGTVQNAWNGLQGMLGLGGQTPAAANLAPGGSAPPGGGGGGTGAGGAPPAGGAMTINPAAVNIDGRQVATVVFGYGGQQARGLRQMGGLANL